MESTQPTSELVNLQQLQEGLRSILAERNRLEILLTQTNLAMEELAKVSDGSTVFKAIGNILIPRTSESILAELADQKTRIATRIRVMATQEDRMKQDLGARDKIVRLRGTDRGILKLEIV